MCSSFTPEFRYGNSIIKLIEKNLFDLHGNQFSFTEIVNFNHCEVQHNYKNDITLQTGVKYLRVITMCSSFTSDFRHGNSITKLIYNVYRPNTKRSCIICVPKKSFQSLRRSDNQCLQCKFMCQVSNIPFEEQTKSLFVKFGIGI